MNRPNEQSFDAEVTVVDLPSDTDGGDPLALFESESGTEELQTETPAIAGQSVVNSRTLPLPAQPRQQGSLPLDRLLQRLGHVEWTESVAIVEALCKVLTARDSQRVPEISRVAITFEGTVIVGTAASTDAVGPVLARMIHALAAGGSVPAPLRLFVTKWASSSESRSIAEFAKDLAFFARPDGQELIRAVYERAMAAVPVQVKPVARAPRHAEKELPRVRPRPLFKNSRVPYVAAAAVVVLGVVATAVFAWRNAPASGRAPLLASSSALLDASNTAGVPALVAAEGASETLAVESRTSVSTGRTAGTGFPTVTATPGARSTPTAAPQPSGNRMNGPRTSSPASSAVRASLAAPINPSPRALPPATADPSRAVRVGPARTPRRGDGGPPVYSRSDEDVTPPAFLHPQLPGQTLSGFRPDMNTIELIVSETGSVERVRLLSTPKRMPDMMLLSGAKNWEFEPATRDGQSVRYRLELSWAATP